MSMHPPPPKICTACHGAGTVNIRCECGDPNCHAQKTANCSACNGTGLESPPWFLNCVKTTITWGPVAGFNKICGLFDNK